MQGADLWTSICTGRQVMAIVNATPDSFFASSRLTAREDIIRCVEQAVEQGASVLDVGGYSSRPGADDVPVKEELGRVCEAVEIIRNRFPNVAVSIDTFRSEVARTVVERFGACVINDISAGGIDPAMVEVVARYDLPYVAMHMRGTPADMTSRTEYTDVVGEVGTYFREKIAALHKEGVAKIVIDPGFGFAKDTRQNYALLGGLDRLAGLGVPLLVGLSRKSMIYKVTDGSPEDALAGTSALNWAALEKGARILRVHDVAAARDVIKLYEYYLKNG